MGLRASLAALNSAFNTGRWVPGMGAAGQEQKGLGCQGKSPGLIWPRLGTSGMAQSSRQQKRPK